MGYRVNVKAFQGLLAYLTICFVVSLEDVLRRVECKN